MRVRVIRWWLITAVTIVVTGSLLPRVVISGRTWQRVRSRCALPSCYHYERVFPRSNRVHLRVARWMTSGPAVQKNQPAEKTVCGSARRDFPFANRNVAAGDFRLEQTGVSLYDTGEIVATGTISNTGEPHADGLSRNVSVRLFAYGRTATNKEPPDGPLFWQSVAAFRIEPRQSAAVNLCRSVCHTELLRHFQDIEFVRVQLEYDKPR